MSYFNKFPTVEYDIRGDGITTTMTDITRRVRVSSKAKLSTVEYDYYDVIDGQTPEFIADRYYGDVGLHWLVLMTNDIIDVYNDWPMSVQRFENYVKAKYDDVDGIHHYEINQTSGDTTEVVEVYNPDLLTDAGASSDADAQAGATSVTNREYEDRLQNNKRKIRLLDSNFVTQAINEYQRLMSSSTL